jgi:hypothetical protein
MIFRHSTHDLVFTNVISRRTEEEISNRISDMEHEKKVFFFLSQHDVVGHATNLKPYGITQKLSKNKSFSHFFFIF